jgi:hypothetical protein
VVALVGPVVAPLLLPLFLTCPSGCALGFWCVHTGRTRGHVDAGLMASIPAGRDGYFASLFVVLWLMKRVSRLDASTRVSWCVCAPGSW